MEKETSRSNSSLVKKKVWAAKGNYTNGRNGYKITKVTVHHMAGILTALICGRVFQAKGRQCSAHYGIGSDGIIGQYVDESDIAYSDGNWSSNCRSVSIEVANSKRGGQWNVSSKSVDLLIKLVADIIRRNKLGKAIVGETLTWHSMYAATTCPGPYLRSMMKYVASEVNKLLDGLDDKDEITKKELYRVRKTWKDSKSQIGAYKTLANAKKVAKKHKGYEVYNSVGKCVYNPWNNPQTKKTVTEIAREIIAGKCSDPRWKTWGNGSTRKQRLTKAGYDATAVQKKVTELLE